MHVIDGVTDQLIAQVDRRSTRGAAARLQEALEPDTISLDDEG